MIDGIDIVIRHALAAQVEVSALDPSGNGLGATLVDRIREWLAFVIRRESRGNPRRITRPIIAATTQAKSHCQGEDENRHLHDEQLEDGAVLIKPKRKKRYSRFCVASRAPKTGLVFPSHLRYTDPNKEAYVQRSFHWVAV